MIWILVLLLIISLSGNAYQAHRWRTYRSKPAGNHSWTGMMPKVTRVEIGKDRVKLKRETNTPKQ